MKKMLIILCFILLPSVLFSVGQKKHHISISTDIFAYGINGFSAYVFYRNDAHEFYAGYVYVEQDGNAYTDFDEGLFEELRVFGRIGYARYIFNDKRFVQGFYISGILEIHNREVKEIDTGEIQEDFFFAFVPAIGYQVFPFESFDTVVLRDLSLRFWFGPQLNINNKDLYFEDSATDYKRSEIGTSFGAHIEYRFNFARR